jgi:hypothetical protein
MRWPVYRGFGCAFGKIHLCPDMVHRLRTCAFGELERASMANKLAGQRMKFTKARALYYQTDDESQRQDAVRKMAEVLAEAPANGFAEADVTQGGDVSTDGLAGRSSPFDRLRVRTSS